MSLEQIAEAINGRQYRDEVTKEIRADAKASDILILYGASDLEIHDKRKPSSIKIEAEWCPDGFEGSWRITTDVRSVPFDIFKDDELYCRGAMIDLRDAFSSPEIAS
jgi:hypothetical protein